MRYAVFFQLQNRTEDLSRLSLPTLSDISHGITLEMNQLHRHHTQARKALDKLLRSTESYNYWVPEQGPDYLYDTGLNRHLGDKGIDTPCRIQDMAGARIFVASFYHPAGLVAASLPPSSTNSPSYVRLTYIIVDYSCPTKSPLEPEPRPTSDPKHFWYTLLRRTLSAP